MLTLIFGILIYKLGKAKLIDEELIAICILCMLLMAIFDCIIIGMTLDKIGALYVRK